MSSVTLPEIREVWGDVQSVMRRARNRRVTIAELDALTDDELFALGFGNWDGALRLIPLWAWNYIANGEELTSISDTVKVKGRDEIDNDVRFGCIAWGWKRLAKATKE